MTIFNARFSRHARRLAVASLGLLAVIACEDDQAPVPLPAGITVVSGDNQYTRMGTELENPIVVRVRLEDGSAAAGVPVHFQIIDGGGSLSRTSATTLNDGRTSVRWTVGPATGPNQLRISVTENSSLSAVATATSSEYYCPEEDPTFTQKFFSAHNMMLVTRFSDHTPGGAGLLRLNLDTNGLKFDVAQTQIYPDGGFINVVRDCAFAANGDLYLSWNNIYDEIVKVATDYTVSHFATLDQMALGVPTGAEISMTPHGVLVGCDAAGPFYVTCRDSVYRFEDAVFTGEGRDAANNDALASHPTTGDVYFFYKFNRRLYKIPFDGTTAGPKELVLPDALDIEITDNANGMVVAGDGSIYILVESASTKAIMKVSGGILSTAYDFFDRGAGDAAGIQNDLAIDRQSGFLYTLDTKNDVILLYQIATDMLFELTPPVTDPGAASGAAEGERVGIDIIADSAP